MDFNNILTKLGNSDHSAVPALLCTVIVIHNLNEGKYIISWYHKYNANMECRFLTRHLWLSGYALFKSVLCLNYVLNSFDAISKNDQNSKKWREQCKR